MSKLLRQLEVHISDGEYIFREGDYGDAIYMLQSGKVKLVQQFGTIEKLLKIISPNDFFGEMVFIHPQNWNFSAIAVGNCTLIKVDKNLFPELIEEDISFIFGYIEHISECLKDTKNKIDFYNKKYEEQKLYSALMRELLVNGKRDQNKHWRLIDLNDFVSNHIDALNRKEIMSIIDKMSKAGLVDIKTDKAKNLWIAVREQH